jgi:hypothetical protein
MPARERIQSSRLRPRDETEDPPDDSGVIRSHDESETDRLIDDLEEGLKIDKNALDNGYFGDVNNSNAERQVARPRNEPMHLRERG